MVKPDTSIPWPGTTIELECRKYAASSHERNPRPGVCGRTGHDRTAGDEYAEAGNGPGTECQQRSSTHARLWSDATIAVPVGHYAVCDDACKRSTTAATTDSINAVSWYATVPTGKRT